MKVAVVHEWFESYAGSERVVEQLLRTYPAAELYGLVDFLGEGDRAALLNKPIHTSFIQRMPFARRLFRNYLALMPMAVEQFDLSSYDVVVSSNHAFAKGVITRPDQLHICYIHTPIRYAWELQHEYLRQANLTRGLLQKSKGMLVRAILHYLRSWDRVSADRVDAFVANSQYIARRVEKTYRRPAHVVYPPVDVDAFRLHELKDDFYLAASRMVPYKRIDVIVDAFAQMPDRRLVVIGDGSEYDKIAAKATPNVTLLGYQGNDVLRDHMQRARAFVFAAEEDFGIMPVEAQACGTPVIAYGRGGATETVIEGRTGLFFEQQTAESIRHAVEEFDSVRHQMHPEVIRANAERFAPARFRHEISELVDRLWTHFAVRGRRDSQAAPAETPIALDPSWALTQPAVVRRPSSRPADRPRHAARQWSRATTGVAAADSAAVHYLTVK